MPKFVEVYTDEQREAVALAYVDQGHTAPATAKLAAAGELTLHGDPLPAFAINEHTIRTAGRALKKRRSGLAASGLAEKAPKDAIELLRRRLVIVADRELGFLEGKRAGAIDLERLRQVIRCVREAAALPGPKDPRPPAPGSRAPGSDAQDGATVGGLAGSIMKAAGVGRRNGVQNEERPREAGAPTTG